MADGEKIVFKGKADEKPGMEPGDVIFVAQQKEKHPVFIRKGQDLFCKKEVCLRDALCGATITITHLDNRVLALRTPPGEVIKPGEFRCVAEEGMPLKSNPYLKGNLYVEFIVKFPVSHELPAPALKVLRDCLPPGDGMDEDLDTVEECHHHAVDIEEELQRRKRDHQQGHNAYDSDEEGAGGGGQRVQCAQQ
jgi:DnaJ family protein A protein 2|eukprot:CAMPEP_0177791320 /NCGR_PEP_ID=MMETSP0491_2-20121128/23862_1 /TAXON_ID=63592 /ORGANISM="Tetraselmis chuii, Strain PLY429" /LENGTH=192 /DNA_ID=CAMNT_0019313527 /DNA_START=481 /DNA_END=1059 /DNA_ORIENTATION=+